MNGPCRSLRLPVLSVPFVLVSSAAYLAMAKYGHVLTPAADGFALLKWNPPLPATIAGFFRSCGAILFLPSVAAGIVVEPVGPAVVADPLRPGRLRICRGAALVKGLMLGSLDAAMMDDYNFTFILIAMATGGIFMVPSLQSSLVSMIAVALGTVVLEAFLVLGKRVGLPPFTMPFCLVTLGVVYALRLVNHPLLASGGPDARGRPRKLAGQPLPLSRQAAHAAIAVFRPVDRLAGLPRPLDAPGSLALCLRLLDYRRRRP